MKSSTITFASFAAFLALGVAQYNSQCDDQNSPEYTSVINCVSAINTGTIAACMTADGNYQDDPCDCASTMSAYACATSVCGASAPLANWYAPTATECGTPAVSASYGTTIYLSSATVSTDGQTAAMTSSAKVTSSAMMSSSVDTILSQTSSAEAERARGAGEVVLALLVGVGGGLL